MQPFTPNLADLPEQLHTYLQQAALYDNSYSPEARVYLIDKDSGYYLKTSTAELLQREFEMTSYFHSLRLAAKIVEFITDGSQAWLLTEKLPGNDCTASIYLANPERLCDTLAEQLRALHSQNPTGCPNINHTADYLLQVEQNYHAHRFDTTIFPDSNFASPQTTYQFIQANSHLLQPDTLIHGDYCLPNIILDNWRFSGFVDLGNAGIGDRHIDLFWAAWSLGYNLKTDRYRQRFFDAYGRSDIYEEKLELIAACEVFR